MASADRLIEVFSEAKARPAGNERDRFLAEACQGEPALEAQVLSLLQADESAGDFLEQAQPTSADSRLTEKRGDKIGHYKLLQQIGEGGCGVVYIAEQEEPVRRRVALKVIKLGMDTKQVIARFEAERQALALMDHPNIAKVFEAGATDTGRPYFVMELVRGIKITDFCDEHKVSTEDRLRLFIQICRAIQHAHQKGIIHRDIKPSNILVTINDGVPMPKVIDFGIAKATAGRLTDQTLFTAFEQFIGTPAYMSPEQAEMTSLDIDTRSDIYSLGVLLYELLTGGTPFDQKELLAAGLDQMRRTIRERKPPRPSTRLSAMTAGALTTTAKHCHTDVPKLLHAVRGDLDWIAMKCLEKDRARRYETANGLAADITRHLNCEPVMARPPSRLYEFRKTVRRHKFGFAAGAAVITVLAAGVLVSTSQAIRLASAHQAATEKLFDSYLAQARSLRRGGREGQRFDSLAAVAKASAIHPSPAVRSEAIACLAMTDLRFSDARHSHGPELEVWDPRLEFRACAESDGSILIRHIADANEVGVLPGNGTPVDWLYALSPHGHHLAARYRGGRTMIWDIQTRRAVIGEIPGVLSADCSEDGQTFVASCKDGELRRFALNPLRPLSNLALGRRYTGVRVHPQGALFAGYEREAKSLEVRDFGDGSLRWTLHTPANLTSLAWCIDGRLLAAGCEDGRVVIWDAATGEKQSEFRGHQETVVSVGFSRSGGLLASSSWDEHFRLWDVATGSVLLTSAGWSYQLSFSPDDRKIGYVQRGSQTGSLEVTPSSISHRLYCQRSPNRGAFGLDVSPDGHLVAAASSDGVHLWSDEQTTEPFFLPVPHCFSAVFTPDGASLVVCGGSGLALWPLRLSSTSTNSELRIGPGRPIRNGPDFNYAALSADGTWVAAADFGADALAIYELNNPTNHFALVSQPHIQGAAFSPDGRWVAAGNWKGSGVKVWDFPSRRILRELPAASIALSVFSPDGRSLATCSATCDVWETGSWKLRYRLEPGGSAPHSPALAFSPDGSMLAVVLEPSVARLVASETGDLLANLEDPGAANVSSLRFSPDGTRLYALQWDHQVQVWDLRRIREELRKLNLDWNAPPILVQNAPSKTAEKPLRITLVEPALP